MERATPEKEGSLGLIHRHLVGSSSDFFIVLVHGRAGNVDVMAPFKRLLPPEPSVFSVQAPYPDESGYSWWHMHGETRDKSQVESSIEKLRSFIAKVPSEYGISPHAKPIGVGFSQGGALLSLVADDTPSLFAGVALLASFVLGRRGAETPPPYFVAHGTEDDVVSIADAEDGVSYLRERGAAVRFVTDSVKHKIGVNGTSGLKTWLSDVIQGAPL